MLPSSGVIVKRITNRHEFEQELLRNDTFGDIVSSQRISKWSHDAFKHREVVLAAMSSEEMLKRSGDNLDRQTSGASVAMDSDGGSTRSGDTCHLQTSGEGSDQDSFMEAEIFKLKDGTLYQGQWMHGLMHGKGTMFTPDSKRYSGDFKHGKKDGAGTLTWKDGRVYKGQFANNKCHGNGKITGSFGEKYNCKANFGKIHTM